MKKLILALPFIAILAVGILQGCTGSDSGDTTVTPPTPDNTGATANEGGSSETPKVD